MPKRVLILCTGNSCRSQMAQVLWQDIGGDAWRVESAGSHPSGFVHPMAIQALQEINLPIDGLTSKPIEPFIDEKIDLVITVCDGAQQSCPTMSRAKDILHWPFEDPANATGSDEQKMRVFRQVRNEIMQKIAEHFSQ